MGLIVFIATCVGVLLWGFLFFEDNAGEIDVAWAGCLCVSWIAFADVLLGPLAPVCLWGTPGLVFLSYMAYKHRGNPNVPTLRLCVLLLVSAGPVLAAAAARRLGAVQAGAAQSAPTPWEAMLLYSNVMAFCGYTIMVINVAGYQFLRAHPRADSLG